MGSCITEDYYTISKFVLDYSLLGLFDEVALLFFKRDSN
jgi:hypothetical protein